MQPKTALQPGGHARDPAGKMEATLQPYFAASPCEASGHRACGVDPHVVAVCVCNASGAPKNPVKAAIMPQWGCLLALLALLAAPVAAQISNPVAHDSNMNTTGNKFLKREASADVRIGTGTQ